MLLSTVVFHFKPKKKCSIPATDGPFVRDAILNLIKKKDLELSEILSDLPDEKAVELSYTVSPIFGIPSEENGYIILLPDEDYSIKITSIDERLSNVLVSLKPEKKLIIAENQFYIKDVFVNTTTFESFHRESWGREPANYITMEFLTPTTFMVDGKNKPSPYPELIFGDLLKKWNKYLPSRIGDTILDLIENRVYLSECKLQHKICDFTKYRQVRFLVDEHKQVKFAKEDRLLGFIGTCKFTINIQDPIWMKMIHLLADFSFYRSLGYRINMRMGQVNVIPYT